VPHPIDGGLFDALTFAIGILIFASKFGLRLYLSRHPLSWTQANTLDFFNGCLVFPFVALLSLPILFWLAPIVAFPTLTDFLTVLRSSNTGSIALAGGAGLFFVLGEIVKMD
jgi:hypothetical protein